MNEIFPIGGNDHNPISRNDCGSIDRNDSNPIGSNDRRPIGLHTVVVKLIKGSSLIVAWKLYLEQ